MVNHDNTIAVIKFIIIYELPQAYFSK